MAVDEWNKRMNNAKSDEEREVLYQELYDDAKRRNDTISTMRSIRILKSETSRK